MRDGKLLFNSYVAQGKGSGNLYATRFSNKPGSDASSIGAMVTGEPYSIMAAMVFQSESMV